MLNEERMKELYRQALSAREKAYAPYSGFCVGAALLTASGRVYTGVNMENSSYPVGLCAERSAIAGGSKERMEDCQPCGMCRQFMYEFAPELAVVTGADEDHLTETPLSDLLPKGFHL